MTDDERRDCEMAYRKWKNPHAGRLRDDLAFDAGYAAGRESMRAESNRYFYVQREKVDAERARSAELEDQLDASYSSSRALVEDVEGYIAEMERERARSAKLIEAIKRARRSDSVVKIMEHLEHAIADYQAGK